MRLKQLSVAMLCIGMMTVACQKENKLSELNQQSAKIEKEGGKNPIEAFFNKNRLKGIQKFNLNANQGGVFTGLKGTVVTVQGGVLQMPDGTIYNGDVIASLLEVRSTADAALFGFPTQTVWNEANMSGGEFLETAGSLELRITTPDGVELRAPGNGVTIGIPIDPAIGFNPAMTLWEGAAEPNLPGANVWKGIQGGNLEQNGQLYLFNWEGRPRCNIDGLNNGCGGPTTPFKVDLPAGYNITNTEVFIVAQICGSTGPKTVFSLDVYNASPIWWSEHTTAGIAIGTNVDFVAIANIGGTTYYKIENATIVPGHFQHMTGMTPISMPALTALLNAL
jgi:hypothetical protein